MVSSVFDFEGARYEVVWYCLSLFKIERTLETRALMSERVDLYHFIVRADRIQVCETLFWLVPAIVVHTLEYGQNCRE
jgi:hypothetical protein